MNREEGLHWQKARNHKDDLSPQIGNPRIFSFTSVIKVFPRLVKRIFCFVGFREKPETF